MPDPRHDAIEKLKRMIQTQFDQRVAPDEDQLRLQIDALAGLEQDLVDGDAALVFEAVCAAMNVRMGTGVAIDDRQRRPWLADRNPEWKLWKAYREILAQEGRGPQVLGTLDNTLNSILDHMGDPEEQGNWSHRGLVIGEVQSGKTSTYIGLIDKAIDVGYRVVILLSGSTELLRRQTQERIDFGVIGRDSSRARELASFDNLIGVGTKVASTAFIDSLTTQVSDFRTAGRLGISIIPGPDKVVVFVTKKNKTVLEQIAKWFEEKPQAVGHLPMLLIDDESDYASINTNPDPERDPTRINAAIRDILSKFTRSSYVAFTATPFANIFIDDEIEEDLFPADLIYALDSPTNYHGCREFFEEVGPESPVRTIDDAADHFPLGHKRNLEVSDLPETLIEAIRSYLISNAIRDLRGQRGAASSMLVNVSRFNDVQQRVFDLVSAEVARYRNAIEMHSLDYEKGTPNPYLARLESTFRSEFKDCGSGWTPVLSELRRANHDVVTLITNSKTLRLEVMPSRYVAIGGDLLSRGLTLEGLSTSYFYRRTQAADTLMQMGRWFGYRAGYEDLCRVWITEEMTGAFQHSLGALEDLRLDIKEMARQQLTPKQFGISVRLHPDALAITARNKMRAGQQQAGAKSISLRGSAIESTRLSGDLEVLEHNVELTLNLVARLTEDAAPEQVRGSNFMWSNVDKLVVSEYLEGFAVQIGWPQRLFEGSSLSNFVKDAQADDLQRWDVVLRGGAGERGDSFALPSLPTAWKPPVRSFGGSGESGWIVSGQRMRVLGPGDVGTTLSEEAHEAAKREFENVSDGNKGKNIPDRHFIAQLEKPVLFLYPLRARTRTDDLHLPTPPNLPLVAVVVAVPGVRSEGDKDNVTYLLNRPAQRFWNPDFVEEMSDDDEDL